MLVVDRDERRDEAGRDESLRDEPPAGARTAGTFLVRRYALAHRQDDFAGRRTDGKLEDETRREDSGQEMACFSRSTGRGLRRCRLEHGLGLTTLLRTQAEAE